jgi:hypothetical protein
MDDLFQKLIYLFIIISFLASLFRKKQKPQDKKSESTFKPTPQPRMETKPTQQEEYDILKEIERMFKTDSPVPEKEKTFEDKEIESEHIKTEDWQQPTDQEHRTTISEHTFENWDEKKRIAEEKRKAVNEKIIKQAEMFEKSFARTAVGKSDIKKNITQRFNEPASLKEYIIFSEIIGKPKALQ